MIAFDLPCDKCYIRISLPNIVGFLHLEGKKFLVCIKQGKKWFTKICIVYGETTVYD